MSVREGRRGFSMIELPLTVAVLGLVTLIATPKVRTLRILPP
jgi:prepilin-type N-terminal cleavage/methylation domain-containing protein